MARLDPMKDLVQELLDDAPDALAQVMRWISTSLASPRFWSLRGEWVDLQQEIVARVIESLRVGRFDPARPLRQYVQGIAHLTAVQALHRRARERKSLGAERAPGSVAPEWERHVTNRQAARWVLDAATEECRGLMVDYFFEEKSYAEIASARGIPVGTVKSRLFRCLEAAYQALTKEEGIGNRTGPGVNILKARDRE